jgi:hypothetical protein
MKRFFISIFSLLIAYTSFSQNENNIEKRVYYTTAIGSMEPPRIDGLVDEPVWELIEWASDFIENEPNNGQNPSNQTKFKILYDEKYIYVAFRCYDSEPDKIERRLSRRDGFEGDYVGIIFDSFFDKRSGFSFVVTAAGVKGDEFISNNGNNRDTGWNPIWDTKTNIDLEGWTAEMRIPLSQLRFGSHEEQVWGLQAIRRDFRNAERSYWQHIPPNPPGYISEFGELRGLNEINPQKQLEIQPYVLSQLDTYESQTGNPFRTGKDFKFTVGLDAKIGITNDLTLDLTINPDFGQVDADPGAIALDGFEIFFQELRPFFVENKNIFDYNLGSNSDNLFFSRRIGRSPQGSAFGPAVSYVDQPNNTTILGAAKFSGKTNNGWSIGILETVTANEYAKVIYEDSTEGKTLVEPLTNYFVGRVQKDFNDNNSFFGGIFTATNRDIQSNVQHLHKNAYTGGIDFRHSWKERTFFIDGNMVLSHVNGSEEAITATQMSIVHLFQREDAMHVEVDSTRTSLTGTGGQFRFGKSGGGNWRFETGSFWRSPELETNDIGFLRQADDIRQFSNIARVFNVPTSWYRRASFTFFQSTNFDFEGNHNRTNYELIGYVNFKNNWWTEGGLIHKPRIYINTILRGGPRWRYNQENVGFLFVGTDNRKKFNTTLGFVRSQAKQNNFSSSSYEWSVNYQPFNALGTSLTAQYELRPNKTQYVTQQDFNGTMRYITGEIDQKTWSATLRVNYTINPNLSIQYYGQPFISRGRYSNFNFVSNSIADDLNERVSWYDSDQISIGNQFYHIDETRDGNIDYSFRNPDFAFAQFRSNLVLRWEYIPGSELFFVWSQGITGFDDASERFNTIVDNQFLNRKPENTFLIKAVYRFLK